MYGFTGFVNFTKDLTNDKKILEKMTRSLTKYSTKEEGFYIDKHLLLGVTNDVSLLKNKEKQPFFESFSFGKYVLVYTGQIYNLNKLKKILLENDFTLENNSDAEILLKSYIHYGKDIVKYLNGAFAIVIFDTNKNEIFLARDHLGVKPLFYTIKNNTLIFSSELKGLFAHPNVEKILDSQGISELFGIGPSHTPGNTIYKNIYELKPAHFAVFKSNNFSLKRYWHLESKEHKESLRKNL